MKRILGLLIIVIGISLLFVSHYITQRVREGKEQISSAKKKVAQGEQLFSLNPITKEVGQGLTSGAKKQIREGEETVEEYTEIAVWCQKGGIALIVGGALIVIFGRKKSKK